MNNCLRLPNLGTKINGETWLTFDEARAMRDACDKWLGQFDRINYTLTLVCRRFEISKEKLFSKDRTERVCDARGMAAQLLTELLFNGHSKGNNKGQSEVGRILNREHGAIVNLLERNKDRCAQFQQMRARLEDLRKELNA